MDSLLPIEQNRWRVTNDTPVAVFTASTVGYIWTDQLDTPREITNTTNQSLWQWDSVPFGETLPNETPGGLGAFSFNLRFPGQYFDAESGLHQNRYRDYSPMTGRYVEGDPLGLAADLNRYNYVGANPVTRFDRWGLSACDVAAALGAFGENNDAGWRIPDAGDIKYNFGMGSGTGAPTGETLNGVMTLNSNYLRDGLSGDELWQLLNAVIHEIGHVNGLDKSPMHEGGPTGDPLYYGYIGCKARGAHQRFDQLRAAMGCR